MCGIVGYIGESKCVPILLDSLKKLEYRGYDSAGIAVLHNNSINIIKSKGTINDLSNKIEAENSEEFKQACIGIGHTRWATHGKPNDVNSHPHISRSGKIAVVHNGIIENYTQLRKYLTKKGFEFVSQTDTEVVAHLIEDCYNGDPIASVRKAVNLLEGPFALGIIFADFPDMLIAVKRDSPLIIGLCENENMIASDIPAVLSRTRDIIRVGEESLAVVRANDVELFDRYGNPEPKNVIHVEWDVAAAEKDGYEHFMLKEIMQQPDTIKNTVGAYSYGTTIDFGLKNITPEYLKTVDNIYMVACGSAYHAGIVGATLLEKSLRIPTHAVLASEFMYNEPIITKNTLTIVISQSGETSDTLLAMQYASAHGSKTLSIVNVVASAIASHSDDVIYTHAGPEIAVATTKAYSAQLIVLYMLTAYIQYVRTGDNQCVEYCLKELARLPELITSLLKNEQNVQTLATKFISCNNVFFIGRNLDYALSFEASLKLKEISYIHSEAYAAGELKHGTLSLIENGTLVIALCTYKPLIDKMISNIEEVVTRGAEVIIIAEEGTDKLSGLSENIIWLPKAEEFVQPSLAIVPLQLFAYYVALLRGCDIDKPRNLAKSVTVP